MKHMYVYILTNNSGTLYIGVTNDLERRMWEHRHGAIPGFTARYHLRRLVHMEEFASPSQAIQREKELKGWRREKNVALIETGNPAWLDLSADWEID